MMRYEAIETSAKGSLSALSLMIRVLLGVKNDSRTQNSGLDL